MENNHIENWQGYTEKISNNSHVKGWMVAIVDNTDSFGYYGGDMGDIQTAKILLSKIEIMRADLKRYIKMKVGGK